MKNHNIKQLEKLVNSELTSKIEKSIIEFNELLVETNSENLKETIQFLKINEDCKFIVDLYNIWCFNSRIKDKSH